MRERVSDLKKKTRKSDFFLPLWTQISLISLHENSKFLILWKVHYAHYNFPSLSELKKGRKMGQKRPQKEQNGKGIRCKETQREEDEARVPHARASRALRARVWRTRLSEKKIPVRVPSVSNPRPQLCKLRDLTNRPFGLCLDFYSLQIGFKLFQIIRPVQKPARF